MYEIKGNHPERQNKMSQTSITLVLFTISIIVLMYTNYRLSKELEEKNKILINSLSIMRIIYAIKQHLGSSSDTEAIDFILDAIKEKMDYTSQEPPEDNNQQGYTLIELMVGLIVLGFIIAVLMSKCS